MAFGRLHSPGVKGVIFAFHECLQHEHHENRNT
jgi:hypothetical protein